MFCFHTFGVVFCLSEPIGFSLDHDYEWLYLAVGAGAALISALFVHNSASRTNVIRINLYRIASVLLILASLLIPLSTIILPHTTFEQYPIVAVVGFFIGGAGAGLLQVLWGEHLAKYDMRFAAMVSPAASIVSGAFVALSLTDISEGISFFGYLFFPLTSLGLLLFKVNREGLIVKQLIPSKQSPMSSDNLDNKDADGELHASKQALVDIEPKSSSAEAITSISAKKASQKPIDYQIIKLMVSVVVFSLLCRMFDVLLYGYPDPFSFLGDSSLFALVIVGVCFLVLVTTLKDRFNLAFTYRLSLPIMIAGFVAIAMFAGSQAAISVLLINIGYNFFDILIWIIFAGLVINRGVPAIKAFGLGVSAMFIGMALGYFVGDIIQSMIVHGDVQITVVALVCIMSLVIVAFLVIPEGAIAKVTHTFSVNDQDSGTVQDLSVSAPAVRVAKNGSPDGSDFSGSKSKLEDNSVLVAKAYGLTPREQEVLVLLAYGRTLAIISRDLMVAPGTARSHMEKIYRKLGVHKQQELIDLVEGYTAKQ